MRQLFRNLSQIIRKQEPIAANVSYGRKQDIMKKIVETSRYRVRQDVNKWRGAIRSAETIDLWDRSALYTLYSDLEIDSHLSALMQVRKQKVLALPFRVVETENGTENKDKTRLLEKPWFMDFSGYVLDSIPYGHSLIELGEKTHSNSPKGEEPILPEFTSVNLVPREHVCPERGEILVRWSDRNGLPYRDTEMMDWLVEAGNSRDLGLLMKAAPQVLWKKNAQMAWSEFAEVFGMPIRIGKIAGNRKEDIDKMEETLRYMGSAAYGVFQEGEAIEFIETSRGDAYNVYNELIELCNSELSKLILGQTGTTDEKSFTGSAQVHERVADTILEADKRYLADIVNSQLIPKLILHGYPLDGYRFEWDRREQLSLTEQWNIDSGLLGHYEIPEEYIRERYSVPVKKVGS